MKIFHLTRNKAVTMAIVMTAMAAAVAVVAVVVAVAVMTAGAKASVRNLAKDPTRHREINHNQPRLMMAI
jgi:hypothetical protein